MRCRRLVLSALLLFCILCIATCSPATTPISQATAVPPGSGASPAATAAAAAVTTTAPAPTGTPAPVGAPSCSPLPTPSADLMPVLTYRVTIVPGGPGRVEAVLEGALGGTVTFAMAPDASGSDWMAGISEAAATGADGTPLALSQDRSGWSISAQGQANLTFSYTFRNQAVGRPPEAMYSAGSVVIQRRAAFFENQAVFAYPDVDVKRIRVAYDVPQGWVVGTSFIPEGNNSYWVQGVPDLKTDLLENVTRMGIARSVVCETCGDMEIEFIDFLPPPVTSQEYWFPRYGTTRDEEMHLQIQRTCELIQHYSALLGGWPGGSRYWMSIMPTGDELAVGFDRWMQAWRREQYPSLVSHVLQAWHGPSPHAALVLDGPEMQYWFAEGPATYDQHFLAAKLTGDPQWASLAYANYLITKRAAQLGLLGKDTIRDYAHAQVRTIALDQEIRQATSGAKSLDDLMALLGQRYGAKRQHFTSDDLLKAINEVAGSDLSAFYNRYLRAEASDVPDVGDVVLPLADAYLQWVDGFIAPEQRGWDARGKRTLFFVALEIGTTVGKGAEGELMIGEGRGLPSLAQFYARLHALQRTVSEADVIGALSAITGQPEADFFDFYTVGSFRPSVEEINDWLKAGGPRSQAPSGPVVRPTAAPGGNPPSGGPGQGQPAASSGTPVQASTMTIAADGNAADWGAIKPVVSSSPDARAAQAGADISAFYVCADAQNLYLRLDQHGGFQSPPMQPFEYKFDMTSPSWGNRTYQVTIPNSGSPLYLLPIEGSTLLMPEQKVYGTVAIGQVLEAAIPLQSIGDPSQIAIKVYARDQQSVLKQLQPVAVRLKP